MINFLINWQDVNNGVLAALRMLLLKLCEPIYSLIVFCFDIFEDFGQLRLFEDSNTISMIYNRIGLILGLFMVFRITFTAIEYLVDPDKILDSKQGIGNIIKRVLIVVILLGSTRYIFNFAFDFQNRLIESNVIGNLILGPSYTEENKYSTGTNLAWFTFTQFYTLNDRAKDDKNYENCRIMLESGSDTENNSGGSIYNDFHDNHKFNNAEYCLNLKTSNKYSIDSNVEEKQELNIIDFNGFICLAVGVILLWIIMTYTVQVAVRVFQLAYLELIAPIPIMMYLMPNGDEKLKKWAQQCLTTFLDFFIRLAIMDFIILVSNALVELEDTDSMLVTFNKLSFWGSGYVKIILIIALFVFVKKVPELLKELFPSTGGAASFDFGLHGKSAKQLGTFASGAVVGGIGGLATGIKYGKGTTGGRLGGAITGFARGTLGGAKFKGNVFANAGKGMANQRAAMQRAYNKKNDGSDFFGRTLGAGDAVRTKAVFDEELALYDAYEQNTKVIDAELEKNAAVQSAMAKKQALMERYQAGGAAPTAAEIRNADALIKQAKKTALQVEIGRGPTGKLKAALDNAEVIRAKGIKSGYSGFGENSISMGTAADRVQAYYANKDSAQDGTRDIKDPSGSRNEAYKKAEANAKYAKDK